MTHQEILMGSKKIYAFVMVKLFTVYKLIDYKTHMMFGILLWLVELTFILILLEEMLIMQEYYIEIHLILDKNLNRKKNLPGFNTRWTCGDRL